MLVTHIVGWGGTGKSTLAAIMVADLRSRGGVCAVVDSDTMLHDYGGDVNKAAAAHADVGFLFLEHYPDAFVQGNPGDRVIRLEYVAERPVSIESCWGSEAQELAALATQPITNQRGTAHG